MVPGLFEIIADVMGTRHGRSVTTSHNESTFTACGECLRASSYEPGNRAGSVGGTNFVFCSYGKFNPGYRDEKCPKGHQNTGGTAFRPVSDLTSHAQLKMFRPGIRAGVRSRLPGQPAFSYEHIEIFVKKRAARRDLGNRASPVNRAHMKRHLAGLDCFSLFIKV